MLHHLRLSIIAALLAGSAQAVAEPNAWNDWVRDNSPHGVDISTDGTIWINLYKPGFRDDYSVRAGDLRKARETEDMQPKFWVRINHIKNGDVSYRETKSWHQLDCVNEQIKVLFVARFNSNGDQMSVLPEQPFGPIVPGTYNNVFQKLFCDGQR